MSFSGQSTRINDLKHSFSINRAQLPVNTSLSWSRSSRVRQVNRLSRLACVKSTFSQFSKMLLRSLPRAARASTNSSKACTRITSPSIRTFQSSTRSMASIFSATQQPPMTSQSQSRSAHAISNPTLAGIEKRWEAMPPQEQAELWMQLRDRMKVDWNEMTLHEKKAGTDIPIPHEEPTKEPSASYSLDSLI